jgi:hypothetical protein
MGTWGGVNWGRFPEKSHKRILILSLSQRVSQINQVWLEMDGENQSTVFWVLKAVIPAKTLYPAKGCQIAWKSQVK